MAKNPQAYYGVAVSKAFLVEFALSILARTVMVMVWLSAWSLSATGAKDIPVESTDGLKAALSAVEPGDSLVLQAGEWRDAKIVFRASGTTSAPITLKGAQPGKTVFSGKSTLQIAGEHLIVEGLHFQDPDPSMSDIIQFRIDSDELANNCRMTDCAFINTARNLSGESRWVGIYGVSNQVDHCHFEGKSNKGPTLVVWLGAESLGRHQIDHNYFGPREELGGNGGETIRVGDSKTSMIEANCVVESNLFERCNGETECISNKSCGNTYRDNTFLEVAGTLTLRHGNGCLVERNVFLGKGARRTGGIRIIGEDHVVRGNYLEGLTGDDARSALSIMMGIRNSPLHRYFQVQRASIDNNSIVDCKHPILIGLGDDKQATLPPVETKFRGNVVVAPGRTVVEARCSLEGIQWQDNYFAGESLGIPTTAGISEHAGKPAELPALPRSAVGTSWQVPSRL